MSQPFEFPSSVTVCPPAVPPLTMGPPLAPQAIVLPIVGPTGSQGEQGDVGPQGPAGPPGDAGTALSFVQSVSSPSLSVEINHNLPFYPAGITCLETDGSPALLGVTVSYPSVGSVALTFGVPFTGDIYLS